MTREDLRRFASLSIPFGAIGLEEPGVPQTPYFCTPEGAEYVARLGCDGVHFVLLPGDEQVYCVDPSMGEEGTYVLPVAENFRQFLSYVLFCGDASPIAQIWWLTQARFRSLLSPQEEDWPGREEFLREKEEALRAISQTFGVAPTDPWEPVRALQAGFDPSKVPFSPEYYEVLGLEPPPGAC